MVKSIIFRVDATTQIGMGHLMRCMALSQNLKKYGIEVSFVGNVSENFVSFVQGKGFKVFPLNSEKFKQTKSTFDSNRDLIHTRKIIKNFKNKPDWLIVDHYGLDKSWESRLRKFVNKIAVIDDLANRKHDCDILLDQNLFDHMKKRYINLVSDNCEMLLGPKYALLSSEFEKKRRTVLKRKNIKCVLVSFGGSDSTNETSKVIDALQSINLNKIQINVVIGLLNPNKEKIRKLYSSTSEIKFHFQVKNMAKLIANSDLAIGAGGISTWERCCLGLPTIVSVTSSDQYKQILALEKTGCITYLGLARNVSKTNYIKAINSINPKKLYQMSKSALELVDGKGCSRVVEKLCNRT